MRAERLLPFACLATAGCLLASELMATFKIQTSAGQAFCVLDAADRHHYALLVLAVFGAVFTVVAVASGSKPAAAGVAVAGVVSLLIFLIVDLPHANEVGTLGSACNPAALDFDAKAVPQAGFWLELLGALGLAITGAALATLSPEQLRAIAPGPLRGRGRGSGAGPAAGEPKTDAPVEPPGASRATKPATSRRTRG